MVDYNVVVLVEVRGMITGMDETEVSSGTILAAAEEGMVEEVVLVVEVAEGLPQFPWVNGDVASRSRTMVAHHMAEVEGEGMGIEKLVSWRNTRR
jgi:hypothetical protein